jgi:hypothetical protein
VVGLDHHSDGQYEACAKDGIGFEPLMRSASACARIEARPGGGTRVHAGVPLSG